MSNGKSRNRIDDWHRLSPGGYWIAPHECIGNPFTDYLIATHQEDRQLEFFFNGHVSISDIRAIVQQNYKKPENEDAQMRYLCYQNKVEICDYVCMKQRLGMRYYGKEETAATPPQMLPTNVKPFVRRQRKYPVPDKPYQYWEKRELEMHLKIFPGHPDRPVIEQELKRRRERGREVPLRYSRAGGDL